MADDDSETDPESVLVLAPGVEISFPEGFTIYEAVVIAKCIDKQGNVGYLARTTEALSNVEALGMVLFTDTMLRSKLAADTWASVDDDDEDD